MSSPNPTINLTATYLSPTNAPFTSTQTLTSPSTPNPSTSEKTSYLASLRQAREVLQERINSELTRRMEEDNAKAAGAGAKSGIDEGKEEENYGEEVVEEED